MSRGCTLRVRALELTLSSLPSPPPPQVLYKENAPGGPKKIISLVGANSLPEQGPPNHAFCLLTSEDKVYAFAGTDEKGRRDIMAAIKQVSGK